MKGFEILATCCFISRYKDNTKKLAVSGTWASLVVCFAACNEDPVDLSRLGAPKLLFALKQS